MREQILAAFAQYGSPVLFAVVTIASIGVPLPVSLLLIVTGSLVAQGVMPMWWAIALATAGSVIGDQVGYAIGRWGGAALVARFGGMLGGPPRIAAAEAHARRWGGPGVFLTRWLVTPLGSLINFTSGIAEYPWMRFLLWDALGEALGAAIYRAGPRLQRSGPGIGCGAGRFHLDDPGPRSRGGAGLDALAIPAAAEAGSPGSAVTGGRAILPAAGCQPALAASRGGCGQDWPPHKRCPCGTRNP
jgi:membrane protein DedA with SNARE-associated domain